MLFTVEEIRQIYTLLQEYPEADEVHVKLDFIEELVDQLVTVATFTKQGKTLGVCVIGEVD